MRRVKFIIWFFIIFALQTAGAHYLGIRNIAPDFVLCFAMCVVVLEDSYSVTIFCGILCGVLSGSLLGGNFTFSVLLYTYSTVIVFALRNKPAHFPDMLRVLIYTAVITLIADAASYLLLNQSVTWLAGEFLSAMLPSAVYNVVIALVMYPAAKKTLFKKETKRKLLIV